MTKFVSHIMYNIFTLINKRGCRYVKIYIDILFAVNFMIDSILIYATAVITKFRIHIVRLIIAAIVSAVYGTIMFFPSVKFMYSAVFKLIFTSIFVIFTFKTFSFKKFFKTLLIFYFVSFIFAGALFAVIFLTNSGRALGAVLSNGELYLNLNIGVLCTVTFFSYIGIIMFTKICIRNYSHERVLKDAVIKFNNEEISITGLIDTGCGICDPISGKPAILIEQGCIADNSLFEFSAGYNNNLYESIKGKMRIIPFSSVGCEYGYLNAFLADSIEIEDSELYIPNEVTVGIVKFKLSDDGLYNAIFNPDIFEKREENYRGNAKKICKLFKNKIIFFKAKIKGSERN